MPINVKMYGEALGRGVVATFAPGIMRGALLELFRIRKVDVKKATEWVLADNSLWNSLEPKYQERFKKLASKMGDVSWLDVNWAINALKDDYPAVASLFLGWTKGRNWLTRQLQEITREVNK